MDKEVHKAFYRKYNVIFRAATNSVYQASPRGEGPGDEATTIWDRQWVSSTVLCNSDNEAVVAVLQTGSVKDKKLAHMLSCLSFLEAKFQFTTVAAHIAGAINVRADALSRNHNNVFLLPFLRHATPHKQFLKIWYGAYSIHKRVHCQNGPAGSALFKTLIGSIHIIVI